MPPVNVESDPPDTCFGCHRCGASLASERFEDAGWVVRFVFSDGVAVAVCPDCQRHDERRIVTDLGDDDSRSGS